MKNLNPTKDGEEIVRKKNSQRIFKRLLPVIMAIAVVTLLAVLITTLSGANSVVGFIFQAADGVKSTDNKVNVLLLGNAGGKHDGPYLTDTIIVASLNLKTHKVYLISLPRDLWVEKKKTKINAIYAFAQEKDQKGLNATKEVVGETLGLPIHYAFRIDFRGFVKAVDELGGLDIEVDKTFDDYNYPITGKEDDMCGNREEEREVNEEDAKALNIAPGKQRVLILEDGRIATDSADPAKSASYFACRFEHVHFDKGLTNMKGEVALVYVRSRKGTNGEGSDFTRSKRQQKVIDTSLKKILSVETLTDPGKVSSLLNTFGDSIETDIPVIDMLEFYKLSKKVEATEPHVLDNSNNSKIPGEKETVLIQPNAGDYGGAYVLIPRGGNFDIVHTYVEKILSGEMSQYEATASARPS